MKRNLIFQKTSQVLCKNVAKHENKFIITIDISENSTLVNQSTD